MIIRLLCILVFLTLVFNDESIKGMSDHHSHQSVVIRLELRLDRTALQSLVPAGLIKQTAQNLKRLFRGQARGNAEKEIFSSTAA